MRLFTTFLGFAPLFGFLLLASPAFADDATPRHAQRAEFCKQNPEKCEQMKQRRAERQDERRGPVEHHQLTGARLQRNGMLSRSEARWDGRVEDPEHWRDGASPKYYVLVDLDGQGEAFAMYRVKSKWERGMSQSELVLVDAIATSTEATRELWRFIFGVDLIAKVSLWNYDPATPLFLIYETRLDLSRWTVTALFALQLGCAASVRLPPAVARWYEIVLRSVQLGHCRRRAYTAGIVCR